MNKDRTYSSCIGLASFGIFLVFISALYWFTLYQGIGGRITYGDSAKWQYLWAIGGTPHSTGYPLFLATTKIFGEHLVFLKPHLRITLISLLAGTLSLIPVYLIGSQFTRSRFLRLATPALLALSTTYWSQSTEPEVYTLSILISSSGLYLLLLYVKNDNPAVLLASVSLYSISLGHHLTAAFLFPSYVYAISSSPQKKKSIKMIFIASPLLALISLGQYSYIYYLSHRGSLYLEYIGENATLARLIDYSTGGQFRGMLGSSFTSPALLLKQIFRLLSTFEKELRLPLCLVAGYSIISCARIAARHIIMMLQVRTDSSRSLRPLGIRKKMQLILFLASASQALYAISYPIGDIQTYYISIYAWIIPLATSFIDDLIESASDYSLKSFARTSSYLVISTTLTIQLFYGYQFNKSSDNKIEILARKVVELVPRGSSVQMSANIDYGLSQALWYYSVLGSPGKQIRVGWEDESMPEYYFVVEHHGNYIVQHILNGNTAEEHRISAEHLSPDPD